MIKYSVPIKVGVMLIVMMIMFFNSNTYASENIIDDGGVGLLEADPVKEDNANTSQEPEEHAIGKISQLTDDEITISGKNYFFSADTLFNDLKGDRIDRETFAVGDEVEIVFKQYTFQLVELRKTEDLSAEKDRKQVTPDTKQSGEQEKNTIKLKNGVYVN